MKIVNADARSSDPASPEQFTGSVWNEAIAAGEPPFRLHVARVTFAPSARTAWHTHPIGQILLAVSGTGWVQKQGEAVSVLHPGDSVSIAAGERHWHGASPDRVFVHIAMQEATLEGKMVEWMEHVTDAEYLAGQDS